MEKSDRAVPAETRRTPRRPGPAAPDPAPARFEGDASLAARAAALEAARTDPDLGPHAISALINDLADHLERHPEAGVAAAALCARLRERGALLGSEIVATAIGRVRNEPVLREPVLREMVEWIEAAPPGLFASQQIKHFIVALTQTHRDAASEDCRHTASRFSSTRGRIREPCLGSFPMQGRSQPLRLTPLPRAVAAQSENFLERQEERPDPVGPGR